MELTNRVAWITGGARMGVAVARVLSQQGCRIVLSYRQSRKPAEETVRLLRSEGVDAIALRCDLSVRTQIEATVRSIERHFKRLDVLVNLSSVYEKESIANAKLAEKSWELHLKTNAQSAFNLSVAAAPAMKRAGAGRIIHISDWTSAGGRPRYKDYSAYYVSKAAIKAVVETMALELAPDIAVNAIAPGPMIPPPGLSAAEYRSVIKSTPMGRWGGAEEIAKTVLFLTQTDFVTGETIRVDGGRHLS